MRPASDGWYPARKGRYERPAMPVLVDSSAPWPGVPLSPRPPAIPGEPYTAPAGRGIPRFAGKDGCGRCPVCNRTILLRQDGTLVRHKLDAEPCAGSGERPGDSPVLASWLPLRSGLSPHGLRHGHQTWLDEIGIRYVLQSERMGHEVPGMRGATPTSGHACAPSSGTPYKGCGRRRSMSGLGSRNVLRSLFSTGFW